MTQPTPLEALLDRAIRTPQAVALIAGGESWSCQRLAAESAGLAEALRARGVQPGARVALHMLNRPELALAYLACWRIGAVAVPLYVRYTPQELAAMLAHVRPALYLGEAGPYESCAAVPAETLPHAARFVVGIDGPRDGANPWTALAASGPESGSGRGLPAPVDRDAPAVVLATSGTTGDSKLVAWTYRTLAALADTAVDRGVGPEDVVSVVVPMMHASGAFVFASCLLTGSVAVLLPRFDADAVLDAIAEHGCTTMFGLPFMYAGLARQQQVRARDVASLRRASAAGDVCPAETERAFAEAFPCPVRSFWASTEDTACCTPARGPGPLTYPSPGMEIRLIDEGGRAAPDGEPGEMLIRSPTTAPGYWLGPGRIDPLPEGWFHTGDLMRREPDGQLRFVGRTKDVIVRRGSNVSPVEVEEALRRQPGVADAGVAGLPDPELGQRIGAVLVLAAGVEPGAVSGILAGLREGLADYKVPEAVAVVDAIPRNALSKVDRMAVAARIAEGDSRM